MKEKNDSKKNCKRKPDSNLRTIGRHGHRNAAAAAATGSGAASASSASSAVAIAMPWHSLSCNAKSHKTLVKTILLYNYVLQNVVVAMCYCCCCSY